ncbi:NUMOD4 domain-containing protein [bacterium]|nr:NUMOD4 domain-containing protein [bacterium]
MTEEWKDIPGWEGCYQASDKGRIKSLKVRTKRRDLILKQQVSTWGYLMVSLCRDGKPVRRSVHRLVCMAFHGVPEPASLDTCHNDGSRDNNVPCNLRWATRKENLSDKVKHGTHTKGENHGPAKLAKVQVEDILSRIADGRETYREIAARHGVTIATICDIHKGRSWKHIPRPR